MRGKVLPRGGMGVRFRLNVYRKRGNTFGLSLLESKAFWRLRWEVEGFDGLAKDL